jgi:hypothetical protein
VTWKYISHAQDLSMRNSRCCPAANIWRIGERRRQCSTCGRQWRVWKKKRGRPNRRNHDRLIRRVFAEHRTLTQLARVEGVSRQALSYRFLRALSTELKKGRIPAAHLSAERLILLADGLWFKFNRRPWVLYLMALRPIEGNTATFVDPFLLRGRESKVGWKMAFGTIPLDYRARIRVAVVDNFSGSAGLSRENGWLLQLCNFHLLAEFRNKLGLRHPANVSARGLRQEGFDLLNRAVRIKSGSALNSILKRLSLLAERPDAPSKIADMLREFVRNSDKFRAYQLHPELRLPWTNGTLESAGAKMRRLMRRAGGLRTPRSLRLWSTVYLRLHPTITCNPA